MLILKDFNHRINKHVGNGSISDKMLKIFQLNFNDQDFRMASLEKAISLAAQQHEGQFDKGGHPYILHPLRLMMQMHDVQTQIVAVLHDVLEDTTTTAKDLEQLGFSAVIIQAIQALTKLEGESRFEAAYRAAQNPIARRVKLADVTDNMDLSRISQPCEADYKRLEQYQKVKEILTASLIQE